MSCLEFNYAQTDDDFVSESISYLAEVIAVFRFVIATHKTV